MAQITLGASPRGYVSRPNISVKINNLTDVPGRVSDEEVVQWLHDRLAYGLCYTWIGVALVAVNARQADISILFSENVKECFLSKAGKGPLLPHVYAVAAKARHRLVHGTDDMHQAIVISGDSGSGKTFTASHMLKLLISQDMKTDKERLQKIWTSVPILMAFGNARTECNDNSSRFGKLIQLQYEFGNIKGAYIQAFLLEKTRVSSQGNKQRNFHFFHQLLVGIDKETLHKLHLSDDTDYAIVPRGPSEVEGETRQNDIEQYLVTVRAMVELGMGVEDIHEVQVVIAAIIHLGNITFCHSPEGTDFSGVLVDEGNPECMKSFEATCSLLGVSDSSLAKLLTTTLIAPRSSNRRYTIYHKQMHSIENCSSRRDTIVRFLYEKLFCWLVTFINRELKVTDDSRCSNLGILDIYGFEKFEVNSLEQLCINYANERLQNYFVKNFVEHARCTLQVELDDDFAYASCDKYDITLALLDVPTVSIFAVLNEESMLARISNETKVVERIYDELKYNMHLIKSKYCPETPQFVVKHFAGEVRYDVQNMCEKNIDNIPNELKNSLITCKNIFIAMIILDEVTDEYSKPSAKKSTVLNKYQSSLDNLLATLDAAEIHFIRCVKASANLEPGTVDFPFLTQQLVASGVMDLIPLNCHRFRCFPYWFKMSEFMLRYHKLLTRPPTSSSEFVQRMKDHRKMCDHIKVGRRSVFVSEAGINLLEEWKQETRVRAVVLIQRAWRRYCNMLMRKHNSESTFIQALQPSTNDDALNANDDNDCSSPASSNENGLRSSCTTFETPCKARQQLIKKYWKITFESQSVPLPIIWNESDLQATVSKHDIFIGDGIVSRFRLAMVPLRFHTRRTCLKYSHYLPSSELPTGLQDALAPDYSEQTWVVC